MMTTQHNGSQIQRRRFWFSFSIVAFLCCVAVFAPLLAGNQPYFYIDHSGHTYFPAFFDYPQLRQTDFKKIAAEKSDTLLLPPIPYSPNEYNLDHSLLPPSSLHWFGTDEQGRDVLSRLIHGTRVSLWVGLVAVGLYTIIGVLVGAFSGYFGGKTDFVLSRFIEIVVCFPTFFLILAILSVMPSSQNGLMSIMVVIGLTGWTGIARLTRGEFLRCKSLPFVSAARTLGYSHLRIMFRHILPNALTPVLVMMTFGMSSSILIESSLSFLGFGVPPSIPSWGSLLSESREFMDFAWWLAFFPGFAIFVAILGFNLLAEKLKK